MGWLTGMMVFDVWNTVELILVDLGNIDFEKPTTPCIYMRFSFDFGNCLKFFGHFFGRKWPKMAVFWPF